MSCQACQKKRCGCPGPRGERGRRGHEGPPGPPGTRAFQQVLFQALGSPNPNPLTISGQAYVTLLSIVLGTEFPTSKLLLTSTFSASSLIPGSTAIFRMTINGVATPGTAGISIYGGNVFDGGSLQALVDAPEGVAYEVKLEAKALMGSILIRPVTNDGEHADLLVQEINT